MAPLGLTEGARWSVQLRHARQVLKLRSVRDAVRLIRQLSETAERQAATLPPPRPPLGVPSDARTLGLLQHAFHVDRPSRLREVLDLCRDDPRRRFVLGRARYDDEVKSGASAMLAELELVEAAHEDGSAELAFLKQEAVAQLTAATVLPDVPLPPKAARRADALCWGLQKLGYSAGQISLLLRAVATHEPAQLRAAFGLFAPDGEADRHELSRALAPFRDALAPHEASDFNVGLRALEAGDEERAIAYNEFAALLRSAELGDDREWMQNGGSFQESSKRAAPAEAEERAGRALLRRVPRRLRRPFEKMRANMRSAGYDAADTHAVLRAMFVSQDAQDLEPAWRVFEPMGRGKLSLREVQAAFSLFGDAVAATNIQREFEKLDRDASGYLEMVEFGGLLRRLAALARGAPPVSDGEKGLLGTLRIEYRLCRVLDGPTLQAMPLAYHAFARRLLGSMQLLGFAPDQVGVVLKAVFCPDEDEAAEATRQAWLLLGGADWAAVKPLNAAEIADVSHEYEQRRLGEGARRKAEEQRMAEAEGASKAETQARPLSEQNGWAKLRKRRVGGFATAAIEAAGQEAVARRYKQPQLLKYGAAPRKESEFLDGHSISLYEFERIVSLFGDYQGDDQLRRCRGELDRLFSALDATHQEADGEADGRHENGRAHERSRHGRQANGEHAPGTHTKGEVLNRQVHSVLARAIKPSSLEEGGSFKSELAAPSNADASFKCNADASFKSNADVSFKSNADASFKSNFDASFVSASFGSDAGEDQLMRIDGPVFADFIQRLRPLAPGERDDDAQLMELMAGHSLAATQIQTDARRLRVPAWLRQVVNKPSAPADGSQTTPSVGGDGQGLTRLLGSVFGGKHAGEGAPAVGPPEQPTGVAAGDGGMLSSFKLNTSIFDSEINVLDTLDETTQWLVPLTHFASIRAVLANLRTAGFGEDESNVLIRALYSHSDPVNGEAHRQAAWQLLRQNRIHLRSAADRLARGNGEFRTEAHKYHLMGAEVLRGHAPPPVNEDAGLSEDEFQFLVNLLGEHLSEGQMTAILTVVEFTSNEPRVSFEEVGRIFRFMYNESKRSNNMGSIWHNPERARELQALYEGDAYKQGGAVEGVLRSASTRTASTLRNASTLLRTVSEDSQQRHKELFTSLSTLSSEWSQMVDSVAQKVKDLGADHLPRWPASAARAAHGAAGSASGKHRTAQRTPFSECQYNAPLAQSSYWTDG